MTCISIQRYVVGCEREKRPLYLQQTMFHGLGGFEDSERGREKKLFLFERIAQVKM